jgi:hypothetical protein
MKCGFYDSKTRCMVAVEDWAESLQVARSTSLMMTSLYLTGRHRLPSPIWCVWDGADVSSVFLLDNKMRSEEFLNQILPLLV